MTELSKITERLDAFDELVVQEPYSSSEYVDKINELISETRDIIWNFDAKHQPRLEEMRF